MTVSASISRMRAFWADSVSAPMKPAERRETAESITRPLPEREDWTTTTPFWTAAFSASFCPGEGEPEGKPAETMPFAPAATAASTSAPSAPP